MCSLATSLGHHVVRDEETELDSDRVLILLKLIFRVVLLSVFFRVVLPLCLLHDS